MHLKQRIAAAAAAALGLSACGAGDESVAEPPPAPPVLTEPTSTAEPPGAPPAPATDGLEVERENQTIGTGVGPQPGQQRPPRARPMRDDVGRGGGGSQEGAMCGASCGAGCAGEADEENGD